MFGVRGADQGEIRFIGDGENDPPVGALKEIAFVVIVELAGHDMAAAYQSHALFRRQVDFVVNHVADPRPARIHQHFGVMGGGSAMFHIFRFDTPEIAFARRMGHFGARQDRRTARLCVAGIEDHKAAILDPAIGIFIGFGKAFLKRRALRRCRQIDGFRALQDFAPTQMVIHEQAKPDQPCRPAPFHPGHHDRQKFRGRRFGFEAHILMIRKDKTHRPADVRHGAQENFALDQSLTDQAELEIFEIA